MVRLSALEEQIMDVLWELGSAFPKEILSHLESPTPPYNTVLSTIRKLEQVGHVDFKKFGRSHQYFPKLKRSQYTSSLLAKVYRDLLGGSATALANHFAKSDDIDIEELEQALASLRKKSADDHR
jgi:predicted transcriptional regulator